MFRPPNQRTGCEEWSTLGRGELIWVTVANHLKKHPNQATTAIWLWTIENILQRLRTIAANLETSVGELVKPKSTLKHLFGTGKGSQVSPKGEVLFKYNDLIGVGCRRNYMDVRISAADMFVKLNGVLRIEIDGKSNRS